MTPAYQWFTDPEAWRAAISRIAKGRSWHTRSGLGSFNESTDAMLGDEFLGSWDNRENRGYVLRK